MIIEALQARGDMCGKGIAAQNSASPRRKDASISPLQSINAGGRDAHGFYERLSHCPLHLRFKMVLK
ncbi:hypothetical protein AM571_CH01555 [Rhizobium etli 8C-3]|uniref:Uncharacterized protein n=1 Tax=Rhizobium etli 8C-3 TaxID=538025 RepID=A0A1L5P2M3_RHIET|nr:MULTISPECIES: hypothetical protein [Rhizobium]APO74387.1 hypothetical protein AM571_CH01555 [Rhizobium etli 8C-3]